ncbi:MAG: hypothetical protein JXR36_07280 [Bacteroidales bacterium]|nr:hypothetical protein [Bacteroidales bacterium]
MTIFQHWYHPEINIKVYDILVILLLYFAVIVYGTIRQNRKANAPAYNYYKNALIIQLSMSVVFALVVMFFYPGDSMVYYQNLNCFNKLFFIDADKYFDIMFYGNKPEFWSYFTYETGYPATYMWRDPNAIFVSRFYAPFMFFTNSSYILSTIIAGFIGFTGVWKLYKTFCQIYPGLEKQFTWAILYFPSALFWSAGMMKDTLTLSAIGWIVFSFYHFFILKQYRVKYLFFVIIAIVLIINIKSYIFAALLPGLLIWLFFNQLKRIKSNLIKFIVAPIAMILLIVGFTLIMSNMSEAMGEYGSIEKSLLQAQVIQQDLTRSEQYGENYYDIGEFEATPMGVLRKFPIATISGVFRPFVWEASNPFILLAGIESLFLMGFLVYAIFKTGLVKFFKNIFADPILIFAFSFVLIFGFGVGLATANFGALVRYKIPLLPFFTAGLFILIAEVKKRKSVNNQRTGE